jgi:hypothetical protein
VPKADRWHDSLHYRSERIHGSVAARPEDTNCFGHRQILFSTSYRSPRKTKDAGEVVAVAGHASRRIDGSALMAAGVGEECLGNLEVEMTVGVDREHEIGAGLSRPAQALVQVSSGAEIPFRVVVPYSVGETVVLDISGHGIITVGIDYQNNVEQADAGWRCGD